MEAEPMDIDSASLHIPWVDLPPDVMMLILQHLDCHDMLFSVPSVCKYWHTLAKDPFLWHTIQFPSCILFDKIQDSIIAARRSKNKKRVRDGAHNIYYYFAVLLKMGMQVVDLSCGQLKSLCVHGFWLDDLLVYISKRSSQLRFLSLEDCSNRETRYLKRYSNYFSVSGLCQMLSNLPMLEELQFPYTWIPGEVIRVAGCHCTRLKSFTLKERSYWFPKDPPCNEQALAIANYMPHLRHLNLLGNRMTIIGLRAILNKCHCLEYLDLRRCFNIEEELEKQPDLEAELRRRIKTVRLPIELTEDLEFNDEICV